MMAPWVHVHGAGGDLHALETAALKISPDAQLRTVLDGSTVASLAQFYSAVERAVPLIEGFGRNLDALVDLFRTFGWGDHAGRSHTFLWYRPEVMLHAAPKDFGVVLDIIVAASKELLVGDEADPDFDPGDEDDWLATRLDVILVCDDEEAAARIAKMAARLSEDWLETFKSLECR